MSDRRERVARAIKDADMRYWRGRIQGETNYFQVLADAAIAAMDADPTEAEIDAACPECGGHGRGCSFCSGTGNWPRTAEPTEAEIDAARHEYITNLDASIEAAKANADCQCYSRDDYPECVETIYENAGHEAMRAALIAARKARP